MKLESKVERLVELMKIPVCEKALMLEMERLERMVESDIHVYRSLKRDFRLKARDGLRVAPAEAGGGAEVYRFELHREGSDLWRLVECEPPLPDGVSPESVAPAEVVRLMASFRTNAEKVRRRTWSFRFPEGVRTFKVEFTNFSDRHIIGTICRLDGDGERESRPWRRGEITVIDAEDSPASGKGDEFRYNELIYYMEKYPRLKEHVFSDFYFRLKPKLDKLAKRVI